MNGPGEQIGGHWLDALAAGSAEDGNEGMLLARIGKS